MFKIQHKQHSWDIRTVYGADYAYGKFLTVTDWDEFEWVNIDEYWLYKEE